MRTERCSFCGGERFEQRRIEYLYSHDGRYLLVPDAPVTVCESCGVIYYEASALKEIERQFFAIQQRVEVPDRFIEIPDKSYR